VQREAVYHITTGLDTIAAAMSNIQNHLSADPTVKIVVVTNGPGIDFLISDAKDSKGREFSGAVSSLLMESKRVPSGVAEAARLQLREGFADIKP